MALAAPSAASAVTVVQTTRNLHDALTIQPPQRFAARRAPGSAVIRVDSRIRYQRIAGFGAAMTDSSAWLLYDELAPVWRGPTLDALFGASGLRLRRGAKLAIKWHRRYLNWVLPGHGTVTLIWR